MARILGEDFNFCVTVCIYEVIFCRADSKGLPASNPMKRDSLILLLASFFDERFDQADTGNELPTLLVSYQLYYVVTDFVTTPHQGSIYQGSMIRRKGGKASNNNCP